MAHGTPRESAHASANDLAVRPFFATFTLDDLVRVQQAQWGAFNAWQQSILAFNNDLWEQWASHFAGGVPIDG